MKNGWYHQPHRETRVEFENRATELTEWIWSLLKSQPSLSALPATSPSSSTPTYVLVLHGYLLTTVLNLLMFSKPTACVIVHNNTGITHLELVQFESGLFGSVVQFMNHLPHLQNQHRDFMTGNELVRDQWVKIFQ